MSLFKKSLCVGAAAIAMTSAASAATITATNLGDGAAAYALVDENAGTTITFDTPAVTTFSMNAQVRAGNLSGKYRSPYDDSGFASVSGYETLDYFAAGPDSTPNPATLSFDYEAKAFEMLWGSIDNYNGVTLLLDGVVIGTITDEDIAPASDEPAARGASYVLIESDMKFNSIRFDSGDSNAFEFANISVALVPLPAGMLLLLTGMAGLGVASRRRTS